MLNCTRLKFNCNLKSYIKENYKFWPKFYKVILNYLLIKFQILIDFLVCYFISVDLLNY